MAKTDQYEPVIGLEIHAQLLTKSKLFCGDAVSFGDEANSHISAISLAHPGTLPRLNEEAVDLAIKLGLALNCRINQHNYFARKNYFYPDLPKGYQVSQHTSPICTRGQIPVFMNGKQRNIAIHHIHIEEDAGKSIHDADPDFTCIDLNRAGVPLVEIVTDPDIFSSEEAYECVTMIRKIVRHLEVCDGNMEEGSLRCDANISLRKKGDKTLGTKVEVKNLNSIRNVKRAIEFEIKRLTSILEKGESVVQQTRSFNADNGTTFALRTKEEANDYRYFPEPDLPPVFISDQKLVEILSEIPMLPHECEMHLVNEYQLSPSAASVIVDDTMLMDLFRDAAERNTHFSALANWLIGPVKSFLNENAATSIDYPKLAGIVAQLSEITATGKVAFAVAVTHIFPEMITGEKSALEIAEQKNLLQQKDEDAIAKWVGEVLNKMPSKVAEYKNGKKNLIALFAGEVKKISKGTADMKKVMNILKEKLNN